MTKNQMLLSSSAQWGNKTGNHNFCFRTTEGLTHKKGGDGGGSKIMKQEWEKSDKLQETNKLIKEETQCLFMLGWKFIKNNTTSWKLIFITQTNLDWIDFKQSILA